MMAHGLFAPQRKNPNAPPAMTNIAGKMTFIFPILSRNAPSVITIAEDTPMIMAIAPKKSPSTIPKLDWK